MAAVPSVPIATSVSAVVSTTGFAWVTLMLAVSLSVAPQSAIAPSHAGTRPTTVPVFTCLPLAGSPAPEVYEQLYSHSSPGSTRPSPSSPLTYCGSQNGLPARTSVTVGASGRDPDGTVTTNL